MLLDDYVKNFNKHFFYKLNTKKKIKKTLCIPKDVNMSKLDNETSKCYNNYYILKKHSKLCRLQRIENYISQKEINEEHIYEKPIDFNKKKYRYITSINKNSWLKVSLKRLNKILIKPLYDDCKKPIISFLHSNYKNRSYKTNAEEMLDYKYVLSIDMSNFYPSISREDLYNFFKGYLKFDSDISKILSIMCTSKNGIDDTNKYNLGQGLSTSGTLALLLNLSLFEYINELALQENIKMSVYVDDINFGSNTKISQSFIDKLFGIIKSNNMLINKKKLKLYDIGSVRKITGAYLKNGTISIAYCKREEIEFQYRYLKNYENDIKCMDDFLHFFVVFQRFVGNVNYLKYVEGKTLKKYDILINKLKKIFPNTLHRKKKTSIYTFDNLKENDRNEVILKFDKFRNNR